VITPFLIFRLGESHFAVEVTSVVEIVPLPEITKLEESPGYVLGIVNLHGRVIPVVDMHMRFGYSPQAYGLEDCIVFLERLGKTIGVVANEAQVVQPFEPSDFASMSSYGFEVGEAIAPHDPQFIFGIATWGGKLVMGLNVENVLDLSQGLATRASDAFEVQAGSSLATAIRTPEAIAILRERSNKLAQESKFDEGAGSSPLAVVRIGEEFFGIGLDVIREFADLRNVTPIPCCPDHVLGQMNLRGDLITITDIGKALGILPSRKSPDRRVVIVNDANLAVGVIVDELLGVITPSQQHFSSRSGTSRPVDQEFRKGSIMDGPRTLSLIDLSILLRQESLIVNEKPS
jgi:purine-binding chemotaxis protein CheW